MTTRTVRVSTGTHRRHDDGEEIHLIRTTIDLQLTPAGDVVAADLVRIVGVDGNELPSSYEPLSPMEIPPSPVSPGRLTLWIDTDGLPMIVDGTSPEPLRESIAVFGLSTAADAMYTEEGIQRAFQVARLLRAAPVLYEACREAITYLADMGTLTEAERGPSWSRRLKVLRELLDARRLAIEGDENQKGPGAAHQNPEA